MDTHDLRQQMIQKRQALSNHSCQIKSQQVLKHLLMSKFYQQSQSVACYFSVKKELKTDLFLQQFFLDKKQCFLPKISQSGSCLMQFVEYQSTDELMPNQFGIPEPTLNDNAVASLNQIDLVLAPLVAFDRQGNRLGMGAGYYDRALADKPASTFYCGLAYSFQQVDKLQVKSWDVPLQAAVTEEGVIEF